jgi:hypothetical protein
MAFPRSSVVSQHRLPRPGKLDWAGVSDFTGHHDLVPTMAAMKQVLKITRRPLPSKAPLGMISATSPGGISLYCY